MAGYGSPQPLYSHTTIHVHPVDLKKAQNGKCSKFVQTTESKKEQIRTRAEGRLNSLPSFTFFV